MRNRDRHPIVRLRRHETESLCEALHVPIVCDPSNADPAFVRNRVRHELLPLLNDISQRDVAELLDRQASLLADEDSLLDELAAELDATDAKTLAAAPVALARRAVRAWVMRELPGSPPPSGESVERILAVARGAATSCEIEGGHRVHRTYQRLRVEPPIASLARP